MALFPIKLGQSTVSPAMLEFDLILRNQGNSRQDPFARFFNDPFFSGSAKSTHKILTTKPIELNVRPFQKKEKPSDFQRLVGRFSISAELGKTSLELGDTTTLTVTVSGIGNISDIIIDNHILEKSFL